MYKADIITKQHVDILGDVMVDKNYHLLWFLLF